MKRLLFLLACVTMFQSCSAPAPSNSSDGITGLWKSRDQYSDKPRSLVAIYEYDNKYYGRMIVTYDDNGKVNDSILNPKDKAPGIVGNPPYCGMDFVYNVVKKDGNQYRGSIVDPKKWKVYNVELWRKGNNLMVRGELWIFGKTIPWPQASEKDLPKGFSMSDIKKFVPVVPKVK